jgi:D-amino-acid oxidase
VYAAYPVERTEPWGVTTLREFYKLLDAGVECGLSLVKTLEVFAAPAHDPSWKDEIRYFRHLPTSEVPDGYVDALEMELPVIETTPYLTYLTQRFSDLGGVIEQRTLGSLDELKASNRILVNCTGVWAKDMANDPGVYPIRGQVIRVERTSDLSFALMDDTDDDVPVYIIPRSKDVVLGGTAQKGNWNLTIDPQDSENILKLCTKLLPAVGKANIQSYAVGLRPGRATVRLELETVPDVENCAIIHNYGHGGAGITLSWGCADEVAQLATEFAGQ